MPSSFSDYGRRDLVGYGPNPPHPQWPDGAKIAISVVLNYEEGSEVTPENGDPHSESVGSDLGPDAHKLVGERNVNIESMFEYGSRAGVYRVLRLFKEYDIKATIYMVGKALQLNPQIGKIMQAQGHEITSHGWRWVDRSDWTEDEELKNAKQACRVIKDIVGKPPVGWYYGMVQGKGGAKARGLVARAFHEEKIPLKYYSDAYNDDLPYWIPSPVENQDEGLLIIPYGLDTNDFRDTYFNPFTTPDDYAKYLIAAFDELYKEGCEGSPKMFSMGLHGRIIGRPARIAGLRKFFEHAKKHDGVWFATREEIADHWSKVHPYNSNQ
ncbi:hypothetical protein I352_05333 [Cryptococcus deuterogattii MMRL2647]|nr:hypothetical protein I352_05333 [Cryptococcus deuterogattii MMRL2647]